MAEPERVNHIPYSARHEHRDATAGAPIDYLPALFLAAAIVFLPSGSESTNINSLAIVIVGIVRVTCPQQRYDILRQLGRLVSLLNVRCHLFDTRPLRPFLGTSDFVAMGLVGM